MTDTIKLTETQTLLLAYAARRADASLLPPPEALDGQHRRIARAVSSLLKKGLVDEVSVTDPEQAWRTEGDIHYGLIINEAGCAAIGVEPISKPQEEGPNAAATEGSAPAADQPLVRSGTKQALLVELLSRDEGASIAERMAGTGWLAHTTRAALTGLRKRGYAVRAEKEMGGSRYWIDEVAA